MRDILLVQMTFVSTSIYSEVQPLQSCSLDEFMSAVKKSNVCIKGIMQTPTGSGKGELESVNMAMRLESFQS